MNWIKKKGYTFKGICHLKWNGFTDICIFVPIKGMVFHNFVCVKCIAFVPLNGKGLKMFPDEMNIFFTECSSHKLS